MHRKLRVFAPFLVSISFLTQAQPLRISDINSGIGDANPGNFFTYGNNIYFLAKPATDRQEWYSIATEGNTVSQRTNDHSQITGGTIFRTPVRIGDNVFVSSSKINTTSNLYFSRFDLTTGNEVQWNPTNASTPNDPLAFVLDSATSDVYCTFSTGSGNQIFKWNHTNSAVTQFSSISSAGVGSTGNNTNGALAIIGSYLYTSSFGGSGNNYNYPIRISLSDGSTYTEILSGGNHLYEATRYTVLFGKLYFVARSGTGAGPVNLYCYDPSTTTLTAITSYTLTLATGNVNIASVTPGNKLLVSVSYYNTNPVQGELLLVDPLNNNSVTHLNGGIAAGNGFAYCFTKNNYAYFSQANGSARQLVRYDLNTNVSDTVITTASGFISLINFFPATDGKAYFSGNTSTYGSELWSYDLNTNATSLVADIYAGTTASTPAGFTQIGNKLYFAAKEATFGREMYVMELASPLAIRLQDISARNRGGVNVINWKNAAEDAGEMMYLQASVDGKAFHTISGIKASGKAGAEYEYLDENPATGLNYYRLMTESKEGAASYSNVVTAFVKASDKQMVIYPNPATDILQIDIKQAGTVTVINMQGTIVLSRSLNAGTTKLDIGKIAPGMYVVQYSNGTQTTSRRFAKL